MADMLATPEDLASLLERDDVLVAKSTLLVEIATSIVQAVTGQRIVEVVDDVVTIDSTDAHGTKFLQLPEQPVTAVSAVTMNGTPITDWVPQYQRGRLWRVYGWLPFNITVPGQPHDITVTYTHGYPADHQRLQLARAAVLALIRGAYGNSIGASQIQLDDANFVFTALSAQMDASPYLQTALKRQYSRSPGAAILTS